MFGSLQAKTEGNLPERKWGQLYLPEQIKHKLTALPSHHMTLNSDVGKGETGVLFFFFSFFLLNNPVDFM